MSSKKLYVIIVETSEIIYEGIYSILGDTGQPFELHHAADLCELEQLNLGGKAGIVFINPVLIQNQIKHFQSLKKEYNDIHWIGIVYSFIDPRIIAGLDEIININDSRSAIISTMRKLLNSANPPDNQQQEVLSDREIDVLKLLVEGNANKEIADKLNISTHTVISHRKNISQKTGIKSVSGLTIYAVVKNIISVDNYRE